MMPLSECLQSATKTHGTKMTASLTMRGKNYLEGYAGEIYAHEEATIALLEGINSFLDIFGLMRPTSKVWQNCLTSMLLGTSFECSMQMKTTKKIGKIRNCSHL